MNKNKKLHFYLSEIITLSVFVITLFVFFVLLSLYTDVSPVYSSIILGGLFIISLVVFIVVKLILLSKKTEKLPETASVLADSLLELPFPVVICPDNDDKIIWYNKTARNIFGNSIVPFSSLFETVQSVEDENEILLKSDEILYKPLSVSTTVRNKNFKIFILDDITYAENINKKLHDEDAAVAYVTIDNLDEMMEYEQEDYRMASSAVEKILRQWAIDHDGFLKEYKQDRYIFVFSRYHLGDFVKNNFEILDQIHKVIVHGNMPVTVSMGISAGGTLHEREKSAQSALETAIQRGGDQIVLKIDGNTEIFGGKIKTLQKRTGAKSRTVANELINNIESSSNVIIMAHRYADFDALGASIGIARLAKHCGKKSHIVTDFSNINLEKCMELLPEDEYKNIFIDTNDVMNILSSESLLVIVDVNNITQFENRKLAETAQKIIVIDHHRKTADSKIETIVSYIEPSASAASELISEMLEYILDDDELTPYEATLLLSGIYLDTNQFKKDISSSTFSAALYLKNAGADINLVQNMFKIELNDFQREVKFVSNVEIYRNEFAISKTYENCTIKDKIPAAKAADRLLGVDGVKASIAVVPIDNALHISARSSGEINVQLLLEKLKGGGHFDSAGAIMENSNVDEVVTLLKSTIDDYLKENIN